MHRNPDMIPVTIVGAPRLRMSRGIEADESVTSIGVFGFGLGPGPTGFRFLFLNISLVAFQVFQVFHRPLAALTVLPRPRGAFFTIVRASSWMNLEFLSPFW
jgi:hypothetical protein